MTSLAEILRCAEEYFNHHARHPRTLDHASSVLIFTGWKRAIEAAENVEGDFFED